MTIKTTERPDDNVGQTTWQDKFKNTITVYKLNDGTFRKETQTNKHSDFEFLGDIYSYHLLEASETIKVYWDRSDSERKLVKDKYGRLFHYRYDEEMNFTGGDDRVDFLWTLVADEEDSDDLSSQGGLSLLREPYVASAETNWVAVHEYSETGFTNKKSRSKGRSVKSVISFFKSLWYKFFTLKAKTEPFTNFSPMKSHLLISVVFLLPQMISANNPEGIVDGNNRFAFKLFHEVKGSANENLFYSPFSISTALAMVYAGAGNETALQISQTMDFQPENKFNSDYKKLLGKLKKGTAGKIKLNIANGLWAQKDFKFLGSYFDLVKSNYNSEVTNVDFFDATEREKTRKEINRWVEKTTNDKIKDLLSQSDLTTLTRLVLVNAIYFYGDWAEPFEMKSTMPEWFSCVDATQTRVPFMNQHSRYNYYEDSKIQALEIPYKDDKVSMVIFLPNKNNGIVEFEKLFDYKYYLDIIASFQISEVRLSLPKFQTTFKINLGSTLTQMGMPFAFSPDSADFSGMTGKSDLYISQVIHQAFINVDEQGTEAAAATAVVMMTTSARPANEIKVFDADHPFVFLIKDHATGSILFMGTIMKPDVSK
jgi:serpin B